MGNWKNMATEKCKINLEFWIDSFAATESKGFWHNSSCTECFPTVLDSWACPKHCFFPLNEKDFWSWRSHPTCSFFDFSVSSSLSFPCSLCSCWKASVTFCPSSFSSAIWDCFDSISFLSWEIWNNKQMLAFSCIDYFFKSGKSFSKHFFYLILRKWCLKNFFKTLCSGHDAWLF